MKTDIGRREKKVEGEDRWEVAEEVAAGVVDLEGMLL